MTIHIYGDLGSGSYRRVATAANLMGIDFERIDVDLFKNESHTPAFLTLNPHGLARAGASVVINFRRQDRADAAVQQVLQAFPDREIAGIAADLATAQGAASPTSPTFPTQTGSVCSS